MRMCTGILHNNWMGRFVLLATLPLAMLLAGCGSSDGDSDSASLVVGNAAERCSLLKGSAIPAAEIGLPTRGGTITEASLQAPDATAGLPEFCRVRGQIASSNAADPPINFQLNLPTTWNRKSLQFGGGGFNGVVVTGLDNVPHVPSTAAKPLARGYLTFGGDSGHTGMDGVFGLNA